MCIIKFKGKALGTLLIALFLVNLALAPVASATTTPSASGPSIIIVDL